ncbi:MAG: hypothetical protein AB7O92_12300 [Acidimicrobiia bacterium]
MPERIESEMGIFVIRAWRTADGGMRARLVATDDVTAEPAQERFVATRETVLDAVAEWIDEILSKS